MTTVTRGGSGRPSTSIEPATLESLLSPQQYAMYQRHSCFLVKSRRHWYGLSDGVRIWNFHGEFCNNVWGAPYGGEAYPTHEDRLVSQFLLLHSDDLEWVFGCGCRDYMSSILYSNDPWKAVPAKELPMVVRRVLKEQRLRSRSH